MTGLGQISSSSPKEEVLEFEAICHEDDVTKVKVIVIAHEFFANKSCPQECLDWLYSAIFLGNGGRYVWYMQNRNFNTEPFKEYTGGNKPNCFLEKDVAKLEERYKQIFKCGYEGLLKTFKQEKTTLKSIDWEQDIISLWENINKFLKEFGKGISFFERKSFNQFINAHFFVPFSKIREDLALLYKDKICQQIKTCKKAQQKSIILVDFHSVDNSLEFYNLLKDQVYFIAPIVKGSNFEAIVHYAVTDDEKSS